MNKYDVLIIGAGPIGLACGIEAVKRKKKYLIVEKGCIVNSIFHYPANMTFFSTSDRLEIGGIPFISHGDKPTRSEALEYYRRTAESWKLNINTYEEIQSIEKEDNFFIVKTSKGNYRTKNIIMSTGFYDEPNMLNIPGENKPKVKHYFNDAHPYAFLNVAVVGAANSAVDVALETYRKGSNVTMIIREDKISDRVKYWVKPDIENRIKEGSIKAYFNSELVEIRDDEIDIKTPGGLVTIKNDFVFAMTGYHPDYDFLKKAGVNISDDEIMKPECNDNSLETNIEGIYLSGVVCAGMETGRLFIENSRSHAATIFNHIESKSY